MNKLAAAFAKIAGVLKAVQRLLAEGVVEGSRRPIGEYSPADVAHYFFGAEQQLEILRTERPDLYEDFRAVATPPDTEMSERDQQGHHVRFYSRRQLQALVRDLEQVFEIRSNSELVTPSDSQPKRRVFISHGRAPDWREVQSFIEKDLGYETRELAQQPNLGRTILSKLDETADECDSAVIVMTGDDLDDSGQIKARENVIHEIGFFQGRYGLARICLMHEEGVNVPSNIHGLVYSPFSKGAVNAAFGLLLRELNAMYRRS